MTSLTGKQAEALVYSYIFQKEAKKKEIMRMKEKVTFMALRTAERHLRKDRLLTSLQT